MKLRKLRIRNYRSFGEGIENEHIEFKDGLNLVVGENNVGKSNILRATEAFNHQGQWDDSDWYTGKRDKEFTTEMEIELDEKEQKEIIQLLIIRHKNLEPEMQKRLIAELGAMACFMFSSVKGRRIKIKEFYFSGSQARLNDTFGQSAKIVKWSDMLDAYLQSSKSSLSGFVHETYGKENSVFDLKADIEGVFAGLLRQKLKNFSEVRQRPGGKNEQVLESFDGAQVADVLATLKMGNSQQRRKFELVKQEFTKLFPSLKLEVMRESPDNPPRIVIEKIPIQYEVPIDRVGAGIGEIVILLTHLIASEGYVFGLDVPELHFHPHAQRLLLEILKRYSQQNQIIVITHSSIFFEPQMIGNLAVVREQEGQTSVTRLSEGYFEPEEVARLERCLDAHNREFIFSRAVLLVEGETEMGAMPVFARGLGKDFDLLGISMARTGKHFGIFMKLVKGFDFPYLAMVDKDVLVNIEGSIETADGRIDTSPLFCNLDAIGFLTGAHKKTISEAIDSIATINGKRVYSGVVRKLSSIAKTYGIFVLPSDFESVLSETKYKDIFDQAEVLYESKVSRGKYCAQEITKQGRKVPNKIAGIIEAIVTKAESS
jgi:putative ATP-dependent endonuclease of OLD family